ncbi:MAG: IS5 family transposase [Epibacterium sp.]|nr:IS5 family transposase [Epibacterium sp.]NQX75287.1 IS5 family transposase [Epibacterium sp.]
MTKQAGFWSVDDRLAEISAGGDPLETLNTTVDFERFRPILKRAAGTQRSAKGGRPPLDVVLKFRMLVLQSLHGLSLEATERMVRDRLSWMRFCGLGIADTVPDANTLWDFREALIKADAFDALFDELDRVINQAGFIPRAGQIIDASLISAPRQRNSDSEKAAIKAGKTAPEIWPDKPAKAAQKDTNARWTVKYSKAKTRSDGSKPIDLAIPTFGYKSHISIDRQNGIIRRQIITDAAQHDGARLREGLVQTANTGRRVWADTAYRSAQNEAWLAANGMVSEIHRKKPRGRPMSKRTSKANGRKSVVRSKVEHIFGHQKDRMGLVVRTIGLARAKAAITIANMAYNMGRLRWLLSRGAPG